MHLPAQLTLREVVLYRDASLMRADTAIRNLVVAPIGEELIFRACMVAPMLVGGVSAGGCVWKAPLWFGFAHVHHFLERVRNGTPINEAALGTVFQLTYTTIFGAFATYVLLQTSSLPAAILVHTFCNFMGFPDFVSWWASTESHLYPWRKSIGTTYVIGIAGFILLWGPVFEMCKCDDHGKGHGSCLLSNVLR